MKRYGLLWGGPSLAVVFWLFDSALHYYGYEEREHYPDFVAPHER